MSLPFPISPEVEQRLMVAIQERMQSKGRPLLQSPNKAWPWLRAVLHWMICTAPLALLLWAWDYLMGYDGSTLFLLVGWWFTCESYFVGPKIFQTPGKRLIRSARIRQVLQFLPITAHRLGSELTGEFLKEAMLHSLGTLGRALLASGWMVMPILHQRGWAPALFWWIICGTHLWLITITLRKSIEWLVRCLGNKIAWLLATQILALFLIPVAVLFKLNRHPIGIAGLGQWISRHREGLTWLLPSAWATTDLGALPSAQTYVIGALSLILISIGLWRWKCWRANYADPFVKRQVTAVPSRPATLEDIQVALAERPQSIIEKGGWMERVILGLCRRKERVLAPILKPDLKGFSARWLQAAHTMLWLASAQFVMTWEILAAFDDSPLESTQFCYCGTAIILGIAMLFLLSMASASSLPQPIGLPISSLQRAGFTWRTLAIIIPASLILILPGLWIAQWQLRLSWEKVIWTFQLLLTLSLVIGQCFYWNSLIIDLDHSWARGLARCVSKLAKTFVMPCVVVPLIVFFFWPSTLSWQVWLVAELVIFIASISVLWATYRLLFSMRGLDLQPLTRVQRVALPVREEFDEEAIRHALRDTAAARLAARGWWERFLVHMSTPHQQAILPLLSFQCRDLTLGWKVLVKILIGALALQFFGTALLQSFLPGADFTPLEMIYTIALSVLSVMVANQTASRFRMARAERLWPWVTFDSTHLPGGFPISAADELIMLNKSIAIAIAISFLFMLPLFLLACLQLRIASRQIAEMAAAICGAVLFFTLIFHLAECRRHLQKTSMAGFFGFLPPAAISFGANTLSLWPLVGLLAIWPYIPRWSWAFVIVLGYVLCFWTALTLYRRLDRGRGLDLMPPPRWRR